MITCFSGDETFATRRARAAAGAVAHSVPPRTAAPAPPVRFRNVPRSIPSVMTASRCRLRDDPNLVARTCQHVRMRVASACVLLALLAGCGGGGGRLSASEFRSKADAICGDYN